MLKMGQEEVLDKQQECKLRISPQSPPSNLGLLYASHGHLQSMNRYVNSMLPQLTAFTVGLSCKCSPFASVWPVSRLPILKVTTKLVCSVRPETFCWFAHIPKVQEL